MPTLSRREATDVARAMSEAPMFSGLPGAASAELVSEGSLRHYGRGTYLFHHGDDSGTVCFLVDGRIEISSLSATGRKQLHATFDHPQFFGELSILGEMARTATALAVDDSSVWETTGERFLAFLERHPPAGRALLRALSRQIQAQDALVEDLLFLDLKGRVAKRLLGLVSPSLSDLPDDGAVIPSEITHSDLASLSGGSRENVTRILSDLQRRGVVRREGRRYVLIKVEALARLAGL